MKKIFSKKGVELSMSTIVLVIITIITLAVIIIFVFQKYESTKSETEKISSIGSESAIKAECDTCCQLGIGCKQIINKIRIPPDECQPCFP